MCHWLSFGFVSNVHLQLNSLHNPEHSHKKVIPYNLQFSTDIHVQQAMTSHGPEGHRNRETVRLLTVACCCHLFTVAMIFSGVFMYVRYCVCVTHIVSYISHRDSRYSHAYNRHSCIMFIRTETHICKDPRAGSYLWCWTWTSTEIILSATQARKGARVDARITRSRRWSRK